jgi:hypothetical protein
LRIHKVEHLVNANPSHAFDDKPSRDHLRNAAGTDWNCLGPDGGKLDLGLDRSWADIAEEAGSSWPTGGQRLTTPPRLWRVRVAGVVGPN